MLDLKREAGLLVAQLKDGGKISTSAYDTAWVASIPDTVNPRLPMFPSALKWLVDNQHEDGSWGGSIKYHHDRLISTIAALIPLAKYGKRQEDRERILRGERYFWQNTSRLHSRVDHSVGFELLLSSMLRRARDAGLSVPQKIGLYDKARENKLAMLPAKDLYSPNTTAAHSMEFLGEDADANLLAQTQSPNGSLGNSPSATAYFLHFRPDPAAQSYLRLCMSEDPQCAVPTLYPLESFEFLWTTYALYLGGLSLAETVPPQRWREFKRHLDNKGASLSETYPIPDADDTSVAFTMLANLAYNPNPLVLKNFEREECFVSYPRENHPSSGVNVHILEALLLAPEYPDRERALKKIVGLLSDTQIDGMYWMDKWNVSPYYATHHVVTALSTYARAGHKEVCGMLGDAMRWLVSTQNSNGSWSSYGKETNEETAYALLGLLHYHAKVAPVSKRAMSKAANYLRTHYFQDQFETLYIGKALYNPWRIVKGAIIGALHLYELAFGPSEIGASEYVAEQEEAVVS